MGIMDGIPYLNDVTTVEGQIIKFIILVLVLGIGSHIVIKLLLRLFRIIVNKTKTALDDRLVDAIGIYPQIIAGLTSLWLSIELTYPGMIVVGTMDEFELYIISMLAVAGFLVSSIIDSLLLWYGIEIRDDKKTIKENEIYPFVRNVVRISILLIFLIFILQRLGFDTTAIITGLGIGGLAVAFALQDTLANFFGGLHILIDKPFKQKDYIKLENGIEGTVREIGWRTTRIITVGKDEIVIPNSKLAGSTIINYCTKDTKTGISYTIGIDDGSDIDQVEKIMIEAIQNTAKSTADLDGASIWVRFDKFGESGLDFKFGYLVSGYENQWKVLKEVNREIFYAFKKNKIKTSYPIRVIKK